MSKKELVLLFVYVAEWLDHYENGWENHFAPAKNRIVEELLDRIKECPVTNDLAFIKGVIANSILVENCSSDEYNESLYICIDDDIVVLQQEFVDDDRVELTAFAVDDIYDILNSITLENIEQNQHIDFSKQINVFQYTKDQMLQKVQIELGKDETH